MDERQQQIRERAGLEEGKYNLEFIDWLRKWGVPILLLFAVVAAGYGLRDRFKKAAAIKVDQGISELEAMEASLNPSPDSLLQLASDYEGTGSAVSAKARIDAADAYLDAVRRGIKPGAQLKMEPDHRGELVNADDALKPEDKTTYLNKAAELYQKAYDETKGNTARQTMAMSALYGLAAVSEGKEDFAKAKEYYERVQKLADEHGYAGQAKVSQERIEKLDELRQIPQLFSKADLPPVPEKPKPPEMPTFQLPPVTPETPGTLPPSSPAPGETPAQPPAAPTTPPSPAPAPTPEPAPEIPPR